MSSRCFYIAIVPWIFAHDKDLRPARRICFCGVMGAFQSTAMIYLRCYSSLFFAQPWSLRLSLTFDHHCLCPSANLSCSPCVTDATYRQALHTSSPVPLSLIGRAVLDVRAISAGARTSHTHRLAHSPLIGTLNARQSIRA